MVWSLSEALAKLTFDGDSRTIFLNCEFLLSLIINCKFADDCLINRLIEPKYSHNFNFMHADLPDVEHQLLELIFVHVCMKGNVFHFDVVD